MLFFILFHCWFGSASHNSVTCSSEISGFYLHFRRSKWRTSGSKWVFIIYFVLGENIWFCTRQANNWRNMLCRWKCCMHKVPTQGMSVFLPFILFISIWCDKGKHSSAQIWCLFNRVSHLAYTFSIKVFFFFMIKALVLWHTHTYDISMKKYAIHGVPERNEEQRAARRKKKHTQNK